MTMRPTRIFLSLCLALPLAATAQDKPEPQEKPFRVYEEQLKTTDCAKMPNRTAQSDCTQAHIQWRIIPIKNATSQNDVNEILVAVRNIFDPSLKIFLSTNQSAIAIASYPQELDRIEAFIHALDQPHASYRITYTMAESDSGKQIGVQHYTLVAAAGQHISSKQGSKIPVSTGSYKESGGGMQQQFTYLDIGMNIDVTVLPIATGLQIKTKVEQSSVSDESIIAGVREPVVRQTVYDGSANVVLGKAQAIGRMDLPGSTRHVDIDVLVEPM